MSGRGTKGSNSRNSQLDESDLPPTDEPIVIEWGKKFAAYDKNGKLIILGYNRRIVQEYADDRVRKSRH